VNEGDDRARPIDGWPALRVQDRCAATGEIIAAGETYVAVLRLDLDGGLDRLSFLPSQWPAEIAGEVVATWRTTMRDVRGSAARRNRLDRVELLGEIVRQGDDAALRYVAALALVRERRARRRSSEGSEMIIALSDDEAVELAEPSGEDLADAGRRLALLLHAEGGADAP